MWETLTPVDVKRYISEQGLNETADMVGLDPDKLVVFLETFRDREAPNENDVGDIRKEKELNASGCMPLEVRKYFPDLPPPAPGRPRKHDLVKIQRMLADMGREETARQLGMTRGALNTYISLHGLSGKTEKPDRETLEQLGVKEAARTYGVSESTVYRWAAGYGIKLKTAYDPAELEAMAGKYSVSDIAGLYGVSVPLVYKWLAAEGIKSPRARRKEAMAKIERLVAGLTEDELNLL